MTIDAELEAWRADWRAEADPLPDLKKKIRQQNTRTVAMAFLMCLCVAFSTIEAFRKPGSFMAGLATGLWFTAILGGGYGWWVRRGAWKPSAQTTLAYAELSYRTAVAKAKIIRLCFWISLAAIALLTAVFAWDWRDATVSEGIVLAALAAEAVVFRRYGRRKTREIAETKKLLDNLRIDKEP